MPALALFDKRRHEGRGHLLDRVSLKSSGGYARALRYLGGGEPFLSHLEQNLNRRAENRLHSRRGTGLNWRFSWF